MAPSQRLIISNLLILAIAAGLLQVASSWPWAVDVNITNSLETKGEMQVHCKDRGTDCGIHIVPAGAQYVFGFNPTARADYYCGFVFQNVLHWFDIYLEKRDWKRCGNSVDGLGGVCNWFIKKDGPCYGDVTSNCYPWNSKSIN